MNYSRVEKIVVFGDEVFGEADAEHDNVVHHFILVTEEALHIWRQQAAGFHVVQVLFVR